MTKGGRSYYDILGVSPNATESEIKTAWRKAIINLHPDSNPGKSKEFEQAAAAYEVLKDPQTRAKYDRYGEDFNQIPDGFSGNDDIFSIFNQFVGGFGGRSRRSQAPTKSDCSITIQLMLTLEDVYHGSVKNLKYKRREFCGTCNSTGSKSKTRTVCPACNGRKKVEHCQRIAANMIEKSVKACDTCKARGFKPAKNDICQSCKGDTYIIKEEVHDQKIMIGIEESTKIIVPNKGHTSLFDRNIVGDLIIEIYIKPHPAYLYVGKDLYLHMNISYIEAFFGLKRDIKHLSGETITFKHSAKNKPIVNNSVYVLRNLGMPFPNNVGQKGALYIVFNVIYPTESAFLNMSKSERLAIAARLVPIPSAQLIPKYKKNPISLHESTKNSTSTHRLVENEMLHSESHQRINRIYNDALDKGYSDVLTKGVADYCYKSFQSKFRQSKKDQKNNKKNSSTESESENDYIVHGEHDEPVYPSASSAQERVHGGEEVQCQTH